jgi:hypothetical protein
MGHIQDRWYKEVPDLERIGTRIRVPTVLHGKGLRYKVRYIDPDGQERSKSYPDKKLKDARAFLAKVETDKLDKQVYPFIGARSLSVIGATTIRDWLSWMTGNGISESHKSQVFDLLSAVLSSAVDEKKDESV